MMPQPRRARQLTPEEHRERDFRVRCYGCKRYMRFTPSPPKSPATRRPSPHANRCTDCLPPVRCWEGCDQCQGIA